ncbi:DUF2909 domain-containing protein [Alteromonadaceae bacterium M269]|nr:DUF2909 domain-containing protein [Alteromonadaceae bacterium M269]
MIIKFVIGGLLIFMIVSLFQAMLIMIRNDKSKSMTKYIGRRVLTSAIIVIIMLLAVATGLIEPNPKPY